MASRPGTSTGSTGMAGCDGRTPDFTSNSSPARIVHEEHRTLTLPRGLYEVVRQREYVSPEEDRLVFD